MSAKEILQSIVNDFDISRFEQFFRQKNDKLNFPYEDLSVSNLDNFSDGKKIAKAKIKDGDLIICSILVKKELTERSGKKSQYEIGKQILKQQQADAGIFIFYDFKGDFRFSLIYTNYLGKRRDWSTFKRFTYFVSKNQTNKTFLKQIGDGDLSSIEKIKEAFSVEKVTKEFYDEIQSWYFWAIQYSKFPKDAEKEKNGRNEAIIRLITRIIFIWFMRERGLVPKKLFEQKNIEEILKSVGQNDSTYYLAILQNLFFATLNTKKEKRRFRSESRYRKGWNEDFGYQYVYRYHNLFKNPEKIEEYFSDIPFLNGGLFDCLDNGKNDIYIDGFTERKKYQPQVPNFLFFGEETEIDLNTELGTKNKKYKVKGLLNILSAYNFTIDENSLDDVDIALDPELLGRVFENLLASYNPETATTARKSTGSYYTPREIVDYMVTESLKEYLKTYLSKIENIEDKLEKLFSIEITENPFSKLESEQLVKLIESVRIVDPAVGSGAFPMGVLNKMVFILNKVDPDNKLWKQKQLEAADAIPDPQLKRNTKEQIEEFFKDKDADYGRKLYLIQKCIYGVDIQQIAVEITKLRFFISLLVDEKIDETKENYGIKPLPNLGFKIMQGNSLIEIISYTSTNDHKRNEMVNQLKKLKDELFSIASPEEKKKKRDEIDNLNKQVFEYDRNLIIDGLKQEIKSIQNQGRLFKNAKLEAEDRKRIEELKNKIEEVRKTKISDPSEHFEWHINFSEVFQEKGGFDIVIANPPYIGEKGHKEMFREIKQGTLGKFYQGKMDLFYFFFHLALNIGKQNSIIAFITTNYYPTATGAKKLRQDLKMRAIIKELINFNELKIFNGLGEHNMITILQKGNDEDAIAKTCITERRGEAKPEILYQIFGGVDKQTKYYKVSQNDLYDGEELYIRMNCNSYASDDTLQLVLNKIKKQGVPLGSICNINQGIVTGADKVSQKHIGKYNMNANIGDGIFVLSDKEVKNLNLTTDEKEILKPWFKNSDIFRWGTLLSTTEKLIYADKRLRNLEGNKLKEHLQKFKKILDDSTVNSPYLHRPRDINFDSEKIVAPQRSSRNTFGYNEIPWYAASDVFFITEKDRSISLKYILALINSKLYFLWLYHRGKRKGEILELIAKPLSEIPIKKISENDQQPFIDLVDKILAITKDKDYFKNPEKQAKVKEYENQIDELVYKLYNLTPEEIKIVEGHELK